MKILVELKSYLRDCCQPEDMKIFCEQKWEDSVYFCQHCGQLWIEERYYGSCSGDRDYRWKRLNVKIKKKHDE